MEEAKTMTLTKGDQLRINGTMFYIGFADANSITLTPIQVTDKLNSFCGQTVEADKFSRAIQPNKNK